MKEQFIGLSEFLESEEITFSALQKSSKAFEQQFKKSLATIEIKPFNSDEAAYLTKIMELVQDWLTTGIGHFPERSLLRFWRGMELLLQRSMSPVWLM